jgi:Tannase and feruloyl esterase
MKGKSLMTNPFRRLVAIALPAAVLGAVLVPAAAATAAPASATPAAARCSASYLASALHLSHVTVDSANLLREFSSTIATDNPDLSAFRGHGGKILIWHGLADQLIFPQGTVRYYQRVQPAMGGAATTDTFARLFLAPGAAHCTSAAGPAPADPLAAVVKWVEHGQAPRSILGTVTDPATSVVTLSRPLCAYPLVARYNGHGSTSQARNFTCAPAFRAR